MSRTIQDISKSFRLAFGNEAGKDVLTELNIFCNGTRSHKAKDGFELAHLEGRREVLMHIMSLVKADIPEIDEVFDEFIDEF